MTPFHQQRCLQTYRLGSQCLSLIGTGAQSKLAAPQTTPMSAGQPPRGVQPESQKHCAESPPHRSGWLTPFHTLPLLNLCSADKDLHKPTLLVCLHCPRRMTSSAHGTLVREVSATGHILSGSVCVRHVPHAISLKDAYVPSMLRSRAPSCSQIVKVLFKHPCNIIMSPKMFTNIFILMESWIKHNVTE